MIIGMKYKLRGKYEKSLTSNSYRYRHCVTLQIILQRSTNINLTISLFVREYLLISQYSHKLVSYGNNGHKYYCFYRVRVTKG